MAAGVFVPPPEQGYPAMRSEKWPDIMKHHGHRIEWPGRSTVNPEHHTLEKAY